MKIEESKPDMVRIEFYPGRSELLDDDDLRVVAKWMKEHRPGILRDIMCEDCPEVC